MKNNNGIKLLSCFLVALTLFFSFSFAEIGLDHECEGVQCEICTLIQTKKNSMYEYATGTIFVIVAIQQINHIFNNQIEIPCEDFSTLVSLKIKLTI